MSASTTYYGVKYGSEEPYIINIHNVNLHIVSPTTIIPIHFVIAASDYKFTEECKLKGPCEWLIFEPTDSPQYIIQILNTYTWSKPASPV